MTERVISLAYSPCPNDTYQFSAIASGDLTLPDTCFDIHLLDIETLNLAAAAQSFDIVKVSFSTWLKLRPHYRLLNTGAALGFGCGPLLVATQPMALGELARCRVGFPGASTTAYLLFQLLGAQVAEACFMSYDQVMPALQSGEIDAGVIIHESRFTYQDAGLHCLLDLGAWWEAQTGLPIPLGGFVMRRSFSQQDQQDFEALMRRSIRRAGGQSIQNNPYIRANAQEMRPEILAQHIELYVNDFTLSLGDLGQRAVDTLAQRAAVLPEYAAVAA